MFQVKRLFQRLIKSPQIFKSYKLPPLSLVMVMFYHPFAELCNVYNNILQLFMVAACS